MNKPEEKDILRKYCLTYDQLERCLHLFGTEVAVKGQEKGKNGTDWHNHTDLWISPIKNKYLNHLIEKTF